MRKVDVLNLISLGDANIEVNGKYISPLIYSFCKELAFYGNTYKTIVLGSGQSKKTPYTLWNKIIIFFQLIQIPTISIFKLILYIYKPKIIVTIDWNIELNSVCKKKGIPIYYLQHGVLCEDHAFLGSKVIFKLKNTELPSGFLCWDKYSANQYNPRLKTFIIGHQWVELFKQNKKDPIIDLLKNKFNNFQEIANNDLPIILVTLSWGLPEFKQLDEKLILTIKETIGKYNWFIKVHPVVFQYDYHKIDFQNHLNTIFSKHELYFIFWKEISSCPLPILIQTAKYHITINSSSIIECALMGVKSLILDERVFLVQPQKEYSPAFGGPSYYKTERDLGYLDILGPNQSIKGWLEEQFNTKQLNSFPILSTMNEMEKFLIEIE